MTDLKSAWAWGPYAKGMGHPTDHYRQRYAILAIKKELLNQGYDSVNVTTTIFGEGLEKAVKRFQHDRKLHVDGLVGQTTANALWHPLIKTQHVMGGWLRAQIHWESGDDPGAEFINSDLSADRGLCQLNSVRKPLTEDEAFDPSISVPFLGDFLKQNALKYQKYWDPMKLAVAAWRSPVGAEEWANNTNLVPDKEGTWGQKVAYYVGQVDTYGRMHWA